VICAINYDLRQPGRDYSGVFEAIKSCGSWWHYLESTWLVDTTLSAKGIWNRLAPHVHSNDRVLIHAVGSDHQGWLSLNAWNWINSRQPAIV
jgi:hypothetical protein